jgi:F-type H+-transporting ATPase subunit gamma
VETLEAVKKRITSAQSMRSIVRTMKILAAVSIKQYERIVKSVEKFGAAAEMGLQVVLKSYDKEEWAAYREKNTREEASGAPAGMIIFGSDMGMCGQFNDTLALQAAVKVKSYKAGKVEIISVGEKIGARLEDAGLKPSRSIMYPAGIFGGILPVLEELLEEIGAWRDKMSIGRVELAYNKPAEAGQGYRPYSQMLLPLDMDYLEGLRQKKWVSVSMPLFKMDRDALLASLVQQLMFTILFRSFAESLASENAARLQAMQAAEKNIEDHIEELTRDFNQARQDQITSELLDIIAGAEAQSTAVNQP